MIQKGTVKQPKATPPKLIIYITHYNIIKIQREFIIITSVVVVNTVKSASLSLCRMHSGRRAAHAYKCSMLYSESAK